MAGGLAAGVAGLAAAADLRLITTVVSRDVPVEGGVGQISCPTKTLRGGPSWVAVGGGVAGKPGYAVGRSYPSFADAKGRRGWTAFLTPLLLPSLVADTVGISDRRVKTILAELAAAG